MEPGDHLQAGRVQHCQRHPAGEPPGHASGAAVAARRQQHGAGGAKGTFLQKVSLASGMKLYFQLTDETGSRTLRAFPIGQMTSFSEPEAQIDRFSNLHVLHQTGARSFNYCVINPLGQILDRQTWVYTDSRPVLRSDAEGGIVVGGGARKFSASDLPPGIQGPARPCPALTVTWVLEGVNFRRRATRTEDQFLNRALTPP